MARAKQGLRQRKRGGRSNATTSPPPPSQIANANAANNSDPNSAPLPSCADLFFRDKVFLLLVLVVFTVAVAVHWHIVTHAEDWVYDDGSVIEDNPMLKGDSRTGNPEKPISDLLYTDYWGTPMDEDRLSHLSFRPFTSLTFRIQVCVCVMTCVVQFLVSSCVYDFVLHLCFFCFNPSFWIQHWSYRYR